MKITTLVGLGAIFCAALVLGPPRSDLQADDTRAVKLVGEKKDVGALLKSDIDALNDALSQSKPDNKAIKRARMLAVVIAINGEALGTDEGLAAAEQAAKVAEALAKEDGLADAKKAAVAMKTAKKPTGKPGDVVKTLFDNDPAVKDWDRDLIMVLFKTARGGGYGIEGKVKGWGEKAPVGKDLDLAADYAQKCATIGQVLQRITPPKNKPVKLQDWKKYAADMTAAAEDAMKAAKAKDGKAVMIAFGKIDQACTVCHEKAKP